jgi:hypothetical protein
MEVMGGGFDLCHKESCFCVKQLRLGPGTEQKREAAEGERALRPEVVLGRVVSLPPSHVVVLHIQLLTAPSQRFNIKLMPALFKFHLATHCLSHLYPCQILGIPTDLRWSDLECSTPTLPPLHMNARPPLAHDD